MMAALRTAIEKRGPPPGCIHHMDRGSHYAAGRYRQGLAEHGGQVDESTWIDIGSSFVPGELVAAYLFAQLEVIDMIIPGACRPSTGTRTRSQAQPMPAA